MFECSRAEFLYSLYLHWLKPGGVLPNQVKSKLVFLCVPKMKEFVSQNFPTPTERGETK